MVLRTTLTIEPAVARLIRKRMSREHLSLKAVVNDALREGLKVLEAEGQAKSFSFKVKAHSFGFRPGLDLDKLNQFADEMEDEEAVDRMDA